jgi:hypothetical protein
VDGHHQIHVASPSGKRQEAGWASRPVTTGTEIVASTGIRYPRHPAVGNCCTDRASPAYVGAVYNKLSGIVRGT